MTLLDTGWLGTPGARNTSSRNCSRGGYVLVPVVMGLLLIALAAMVLNNESVMNAAEVGGLHDAVRAEHVAQSGLEHALWLAEHGACGGDVSIDATSLGPDQYVVSATGGTASTTYVVGVDQDAWIRNDDPGRNNGSTSWNHIRFEGGLTGQVLTRFDLRSIPADDEIQSATAWFYLKTLKPHEEGPVSVHAISEDWTELSVTWDSFAGAYSPDTLAMIPAQDTGAVWVGFNLTAQVQAWMNGVPNHGILLKTTSEGIHTEYTGRADGSNPPRLEIVAGSGPTSPLDIHSEGALSNGTARSLERIGTTALQPADTLTMRPGPTDGKDTYAWAANKTTNYGTDDETWVATGSSNAATALFEFPMGRIPARARILSATLSAYHRSGNDANVPITAHRITEEWIENEATWNRRENGTDWTTSGGDFDASIISTTLVGPASSRRYEWDITSLVRGWVDGDYPNHGVILRTEEPGTFGERFDTSDHVDPTRRPALTIRYACECGHPCMAPQGSGNVLMVVGSSPTNLSDGDESIRRHLEDWGYSVSLIRDDDSQGNYDSAIAANDVVLVSESVSSGNVRTKLTSATKGVVNAEANLNDELGLSANAGSPVDDQIKIVENAHYITSPFRLESVAFKDAATKLAGVGGTLAPGAQILAEIGGAGSLVVLDTGAETVGGGSAAGRRVLIPVGEARYGWEALTNEGRLIVQRALTWGMNAAGTAGGPQVLLIVGNATTLSTKDVGYKALIESWGYTVALLDDGASQGEYDGAIDAADVIYASGSASGAAMQDKATKTTKGIVNEVSGKLDNFGFSSITSVTSNFATLARTNPAHYITEPYAGGPVTVFTAPLLNPVPGGTIAPDLMAAAGSPGMIELGTLAAGAIRHDNDPSPGRRVHMPFAAAEADDLTTDGETLIKRALEWAAGADLPLTGPIANWKLDDAVGKTAIDSEGGHDASLLNDPLWTTGTIDGALAFDGSNDFLNVVHSDTLSLSSFSISAWIRPTELADWQIILHKGTSANVSNYYLGTYDSMLIMGYFSGTWVEFADIDAGLAPATWYHVVGTYDDTTRRGKLYLNGVEVHSSVASQSPTPNGESIWIGRTGLGEYWPGDLDDIWLYDRAVDASEVANLYVLGGGGGGGGSGPFVCAGTYRDEFNDRTFSNSDGSIDWSATPWEEIRDSDGPTSGDVIVMTDESDYQLRVRDNDYGATRLVNLDGATTASLSLTYRRSQLDKSSDYVTLSISTNGTAGPWTELQQFETDNDTSYQPFSTDITDHISADTAIRLLSSSGMGNKDQVYFDDIEISCAP